MFVFFYFYYNYNYDVFDVLSFKYKIFLKDINNFDVNKYLLDILNI